MHVETVSITECGPSRIASRCVSWSASGTYLAFGSSDRLARLYSVEPSREVLVISGHQGPVTHVRFHPSEKTLVRFLRDAEIDLHASAHALMRACHLPIGLLFSYNLKAVYSSYG